MFTQIQLKQLKELFTVQNEQIKRSVREELTIEIKKLREESLLETHHISVRFDDMEDELKNIQISNMRLEKSQEELRTGQDELQKGFQDHNKTLNYIKKKLNYIHKTVGIIGRMYNEEIVGNTKRIKKLEEIVGVVSSGH